MKIVIIGANGTIGKAVAAELSQRHQVIKAGRQSGDEQVDMGNMQSVEAFFKRVNHIDAIVVTAGNVHFGPLAEMTPARMAIGLQSKLMGQVNLVLAGQHALNDGGSFTLVSGVVSHDPIRLGANASMVNGAVEAFMRSAAIELPRGLRINVISPTVLEESMGNYAPYFRGFEPVPAKRVALAFSKSVEGAQTGQVYSV